MDNATNFVDYLKRACCLLESCWQDSNKRAADFKGGTCRNAVSAQFTFTFPSESQWFHAEVLVSDHNICVCGAKWHQKHVTNRNEASHSSSKQGPWEERQDLIRLFLNTWVKMWNYIWVSWPTNWQRSEPKEKKITMILHVIYICSEAQGCLKYCWTNKGAGWGSVLVQYFHGGLSRKTKSAEVSTFLLDRCANVC